MSKFHFDESAVTNIHKKVKYKVHSLKFIGGYD